MLTLSSLDILEMSQPSFISKLLIRNKDSHLRRSSSNVKNPFLETSISSTTRSEKVVSPAQETLEVNPISSVLSPQVSQRVPENQLVPDPIFSEPL